MRTFIALQLPEDFALDTAALARGLSASLEGRFLPRRNHHLTLAFLGETDETDVARTIEALKAAIVTLFKSTLEREGALYKPLHTVDLGV